MEQYLWTKHAVFKMKYYGLSKQKVSGVIRRPDRVEKGVVGNNTVAVMQAVSPKMQDGKKIWKQEVWVMYQKKKVKKNQLGARTQNQTVARLQKLLDRDGVTTIISAWRYPGVSPKNNPIPEEILQEILDTQCI
ncbi:MAG: hypothetical protein PHT88_02705 [Candidatus Moranbacteria bacterium]|nr:hypothetical protein [Candidatus Moranbacteria bacterium]